jgi:flagellar protein FlbD
VRKLAGASASFAKATSWPDLTIRDLIEEGRQSLVPSFSPIPVVTGREIRENYSPVPPLLRWMIHVTRLNQSSVVLNSDLIEQIESTPDTLITLTNNQKLIVLETADEIVERIRLYRRSILLPQSSGA